MISRLSEEQRQALRDCPDGPVTVEDDQTQRTYVLIDRQLHDQAMAALRQSQDSDAIQAGIDDMEAGRIVSFAEADARIRSKLGLPPRS